jgi:GAF domain-containing protein
LTVASHGDGGGGRGETALRPEILFDQFDERLAGCREPATVASAVLDAAIALHGAQFGTLQLLDRNQRDLVIVAQRGFGPEFLSTFSVVPADGGSPCARAARGGEPILIPDIDADAGCVPYRAMAANAGFRSMQSTPMAATDGRVFGVLSTHFAAARLPSRLELSMARLYGMAACDALRRFAGDDPAPRVIPLVQADEPADKLAYLELASTHIADATSRILRRQDDVDRLRQRGLPAADADDLLRIAIRALELLLWHRRIITRGPSGD